MTKFDSLFVLVFQSDTGYLNVTEYTHESIRGRSRTHVRLERDNRAREALGTQNASVSD